MTDISIKARDGGSFSAYLAVPKSGRGPGLVVIQEIFGVNRVMRDICDEFAAQGYTAICPDLFWRQQPGIQITDKTKAEWDRAFQLMQGLDQDKAIDDLKATLAALRANLACAGKAGVVGYCLGGRLTFMMAARSDSDCSVAYYGVMLDPLLGEASSIKRPLMMHMAEKDAYAGPETQAKVKQIFKSNEAVVLHSYPGMEHAFARVGGEHYDKTNADLANRRTGEFFHAHLGA